MKYSLLLLLVLAAACTNNRQQDKVAEAGRDSVLPAAAQQLYSAIRTNPDSIGLRLQLVEMLDSMASYQPALQQMDSLITRDSLNYGLWFRKAQLLEKVKDTTGAIRSYRYAARIYPSPDALLSMANLYAERKDPAALELCKQVNTLRLGREYNAHCDFISGVYYARSGNRDKAIALFNSCIANDYRYMEAYMEKGFLYYENKQPAEALKVFELAVAVNNTYADGYYWAGKCNEVLNNKDAAASNYRLAISLDAGMTDAANALKRLGVS